MEELQVQFELVLPPALHEVEFLLTEGSSALAAAHVEEDVEELAASSVLLFQFLPAFNHFHGFSALSFFQLLLTDFSTTGFLLAVSFSEVPVLLSFSGAVVVLALASPGSLSAQSLPLMGLSR